MSRDFGKISIRLWQSKKFKSLDDQEKLLYVYFHTNIMCNSIGCYQISKGYIMVDLGWNIETIDRAIKGLSKGFERGIEGVSKEGQKKVKKGQNGLIEWDDEEEIVKINKFLTFSPLTNANHAKGAVRIALLLPDSKIKLSVINDLAKTEWGKKSTLIAEWLRGSKGVSYKDQDQDQDQEEEYIGQIPLLDGLDEKGQKSPKPDLDAEFDQLWNLYDFKVKRKDSYNKFKTVRKKVDFKTIHDGVVAYNEYLNDEANEWRQKCALVVWLNGERWNDDMTSENSDEDELEMWRFKIKQFELGSWDESRWGLPPDHPDCYVPQKIRKEFNIQSVDTEY